jgi:hypothetical protein
MKRAMSFLPLTQVNDYSGEFHTVGNSVQSDGL